MGFAATFSVILATCDRPALVADALRSIASQSRPPLEVRIADDGATPAADVVDCPPELHVTWVRTDASGPAVARNRAARDARGDILAFLDDDDRWRRFHLERLASAFDDESVELAYTDAEVVRERIGPGGERIDLERRTLAHDWDPEMMRVNDWIAPSAFAVRRSRFEALSGFDESFAASEDWDFLLRAARHTTPRRVVGVTTEIRMRDSGNQSADFGPERIACLARLASRHGLPPLEPRTFWEVAGFLSRSAGPA